MKMTSLAIMLAAASMGAQAQVYVDGYVKKDGTYVAPHHRSAPDNTISNNYSTKGNVNPYTGQPGRVVDHSTDNYQQPQRQQLEQPRQFERQQQPQQRNNMRDSGYAPACNPNYPATCTR